MMANFESGVQLLARLGSKPTLTTLEPALFPGGPAQKAVYEFYGEEGTGKNQLLLHLLANAILPKSWNRTNIGGHCVSVLYIDLDYHFSVIRLATILEHRIRQAVENSCEINENQHDLSTDEMEGIMKACLSRLYLVRCASSRQWLVTMHSLETLLSNKPDVCIMMISSISAFYWLDRSIGGDKRSHENIMTKIAGVIEKLISTYNLVLFCTKSALFRRRTNGDVNSSLNVDSTTSMANWSDSRPVADHSEYMCWAWQKLVSCRFILTRKDEASKCSKSIKQLFHVTLDGDRNNACKTFKIDEGGVQFIMGK